MIDLSLQILGTDEIEAIYALPVFDQEERLHYFSLSPTERTALSQLHTVKSKTVFILQLGYFKARYQFFVFDYQTVSEDAQFVQALHFPNAARITDLAIAKGTRLKQQQIILDLFQYRTCGEIERQDLAVKAQQVARVYSKPIYVFRELKQYLAAQRLIAPGYTTLQELIGKALTQEQNRITSIAHEHLTAADVNALKQLLANPRGLYEITLLKREPRDFSNRPKTGERVTRGMIMLDFPTK